MVTSIQICNSLERSITILIDIDLLRYNMGLQLSISESIVPESVLKVRRVLLLASRLH